MGSNNINPYREEGKRLGRIFLLVILFLAVFGYCANAQESYTITESTTSGGSTYTPNPVDDLTVNFGGESITLHKSKKGSYYYEKVSAKTGNTYKVYLGELTGSTHTNGSPTFTTKTKTHYLAIGRGGTITKREL